MRLAGGETIDDDFIALNGSSYSMSNDYTENGSYAAGITIHTNKDVTITIDGPVGIANGNLFKIEQVGSLTIENKNDYKVETTTSAIEDMFRVESTNTGTITVNGGVYENVTNNQKLVFYTFGGKLFLNDVTATTTGNAVALEDAEVTIDGGEYTVVTTQKHPTLWVTSGTLTVKNAKVFNKGDETKVIHVGDGVCNLEKVDVTAVKNMNAVSVLGNGTANIKGGTYTAENSPTIYNEGTVNILEGGTYTSVKAQTIYNGGTLNIDDGTYTSTGEKSTIGNAGTANIKGGTYTSVGTSAIYNAAESTLDIDGGTYTAGTHAVNNDGTATITNGTFKGNTSYGTVHKSYPALMNSKTMTVTGATVSAEQSIGICATGDGTTTINDVIIKDSKAGIGVAQCTGEVKLNSAEFENNEYDIRLGADQTITIADTFTGHATVSVAEKTITTPRQITTNNNPAKRNLVSAHAGYRVAYNEEDGYYYLTPRTAGKITVDAEDAKAALEDGTELDANTEIDKDTRVDLTAVAPGAGWEFIGWELKVDGEDRNDLLQDADTENPYFVIPADMDAENVTVRALYNFVGADDSDTGASTGGAAAAVVLGAAAAWGVYEAGTGIYRMVNMKGIPMPANRGELALLIWEHAGKPEPAGDALYADIDADNTDLQKAAHWAVEQDLMDEKANNNFKPGTYVTKLRTCVTWDKAKQKGLLQ